MECCGVNRITAFCPDCGKSLRDSAPLETLCIYLRSTAKAQAKTLRDRQNDKEDEVNRTNGEPRDFFVKRVERQAKAVDKWNSWVAAVESVLKERNQKES